MFALDGEEKFSLQAALAEQPLDVLARLRQQFGVATYLTAILCFLFALIN